VNPKFKNADVQSCNLNVQQGLGHTMALMVGYFGSKGTHLEIDRNVNQLINFGVANTPGAHNVPFFQLSPSSPFLPGTRLGNLTERDTSANSTYNGLWVTLNKHVSHGLQFNGSYTWSHSIDDVSRNNNGVVLPDSTNLLSGKGNSDFDARHRFVVNAIYDLPFKANRFVRGWELATIAQYQTGNPFTIVIPSATITGLSNTVTPIQLAPFTVTGNPLGQWILPPGGTFAGIFANPATQTTLGNVARNSVYGPGFANVDLSLVKNTKITERINFQIRGDAFDILNHPNYGQPGRTLNALTGASLFTITSTRFPPGDSGSSRQLQLAAKLQF